MKIQQTKKINISWLAIATLCLSLFLTCNASAENIPELPYGFSVKWDISKNNNLLVQDFVVNKRDPISAFHLAIEPIKSFQTKSHAYYMCISFQTTNTNKYFASGELKQVEDFLGSGNNYIPGVSIPVSIKIEKIDNDNVLLPFLEKTINTVGWVASSSGFVNRLIDQVVLPAGKYRISVSTPRGIKLPPNVETFLDISHPGD